MFQQMQAMAQKQVIISSLLNVRMPTSFPMLTN